MTHDSNSSNQNIINSLILDLVKINGLAEELEIKASYDLLDLIAYSDPCGDGGVYCIFESQDDMFALLTYNNTTDQGFLPLLSNQQVDQNRYAYIVDQKLTLLENKAFKLIGSRIDESENDNKMLNIFLSAKVNHKSEEYLWYSKPKFLDIIKSQLDEFPGFDFELIENYLA